MPTRWIARTARVALSGWMLAQGMGAVYQIYHRYPHQVETRRLRDQIVEASAGLGHPHTYLVGGEIFGHYGQAWNFHSRDKTRFVSSFDERYFPGQVAAEAADSAALASNLGLAKKTAATLDDLGVVYGTTPTESLVFFHDLVVPIPRQRAVRPQRAVWEQTQTPASRALDRREDTHEPWPHDATLRIDFATPTELSGLLLFSPSWVGDDLPDSLRLEGSTDGVTFRPLAEVSGRFNAAYRAGDRVYLKGFLPAMEVALEPTSVLSLRLRAASSGPVALTELFLFASETEPVGAGLPVDLCRERMAASGIRFVFADRRQSARLRGHAPAASRQLALPPFNPKNPASLTGRDFRPSPDTGILVEHRFADDAIRTLQALYGPEIIAAHESIGGYELLTLHAGPAGPLLYWNGFTVLARSAHP